MSDTVLEVRGLTKEFPGVKALKGVDFDVVEGEDGEELWLRAVALSTDGTLSVRMSASGDPADAAGLGERLAKEMLADGAADLESSPESGPESVTESGPGAATTT